MVSKFVCLLSKCRIGHPLIPYTLTAAQQRSHSYILQRQLSWPAINGQNANSDPEFRELPLARPVLGMPSGQRPDVYLVQHVYHLQFGVIVYWEH